MFEPLRELLPEDPQALVDDARVLGEKAGRLFGSRDIADYVALGGALYSPVRCANEGVVRWDGDATAGGASSTRASSSSLQGNEAREASSWFASAVSWLASADTHSERLQRCRRSRRSRIRGYGSRGGSELREAVLALPHVLPHLLHRAVTAAAFFFPGLRSLFPTAVPSGSRLLEARQSHRGGPERVTAVAFHPLYLWLAVALDEGAADGSARVVLYDVSEECAACVLSHGFQKDVQWLEWKPFAADVLAVGCRGGVLLWSLTAGAPQSSRSGSDAPPLCLSKAVESTARAVFYRTHDGFAVTSAAFSHMDASMLACSSIADTRLYLVNVRQPPFAPQALSAVVVPSVDGAVQQVVFDDDDLFLICAISEHASLALVHTSPALSGAAAGRQAAASGVHQVTTVHTPAPVHCITRASGLGPSVFFMATRGLEGVLLARVNPSVGVEVISLISTRLYRGVGGCVTRFTCSRRRLWMHTETNHLVVCRYGRQDESITLIPIGVATSEAVEMTSFAGCTTGSLLAVVEEDGTVSMIPSYHS